MNLDELAAQMEDDELQDAEKLTPREFGRLIGIAPQLVYYHIRTGTLTVERCQCGRKVVDVRSATEALQKKARQRGQTLDTRPDAVRAEGGQGPLVQGMSQDDSMEGPSDEVREAGD